MMQFNASHTLRPANQDADRLSVGFWLLVSGSLVLLMALPYLLGSWLAGPDLSYTGLIMNPEDSQTYFAKILQGTDGAWLYTIPFTPEPHRPAMVGVFYVWLGQLARLLGLTPLAIWHAARVVAQLLLFGATAWFVAGFADDGRSRRTAFLLALLGSGLGWLLFLLAQPYWLGAFPVDFKQPGAHLFFTALTFPHITLGTALILVSVRTLWRLAARPSWPAAVALGAGHLLLGIAYPFLIYLVAAIAALLLLYRLLALRRVPWLFGWQTAVSFLIPLPLYLYYAIVLQSNPVFAAWDAQAGTPSPPWPHYLLAFGPYLLLGALYWWRRPAKRAETAVLWLWILAAALLLYAPLNPQRRFVQGVHAPLAVLAALAWCDVLLPWLAQTRPWRRIVAHPRYSTPGLARLLTAGFLFLMSLSNLYVLSSLAVSNVVQQPDLIFRPRDEVAAAAWLRAEGAGRGVLLGAYQTGSLVAAQAGQRVVLGHWAETVDVETKTAEVARFFAAETPDSWRQALLQRYRVTYVWVGPRERALATPGFAAETAVYLTLLYSNDTITIYQVSGP